jgi:hypothetical protein
VLWGKHHQYTPAGSLCYVRENSTNWKLLGTGLKLKLQATFEYLVSCIHCGRLGRIQEVGALCAATGAQLLQLNRITVL